MREVVRDDAYYDAIKRRFAEERELRLAYRPEGTQQYTSELTGALDDRKRDLSWDDLDYIKKESGLPVIVKGVLSAKVAAMAVKRGMDAVYVSNHGGRAFDGVQATISALPRIADAVEGRVPIILDGGIRRGIDVFKALALGANVVACGRPILYGLALGGSLGVQSVLEYLRDNLALVMRLAGTSTIKDITREYLVPEAGEA